MGRLNFFKKKSKAPEENPYQGQPAADENPYSQPQAQSWESPRPGSTLPPYSDSASIADQKTPPPGYHSTFSSTSPRPGYASQPLGARDGVGRTQRFDASPVPGQPQQQSYGGLDDRNERLFPANYNPPKQAPRPTHPQDGPDSTIGPGEDGRREMTDDEQANATYAQVNRYLDDGVMVARNIRGLAEQAQDRFGEVNWTVDRQGEMMNRAQENLTKAGASAQTATRAAKEVGISGQWFSGIRESQRDNARNKAAFNDRGAVEQELEAEQQRRQQSNQELTRKLGDNTSKPRTLGLSGTKNPNRFDCEMADEMEEKDQFIEESLQQTGLIVNQLHQHSVALNHKLEYQVQQASRMAEMAERANHQVGKGQTVLNGYLK